MKRCPTCTQLFDDSQSFCANDGTRLVADDPVAPDFDPMATIMSPPPPTTGEFRPPAQTYSDPLPPPPQPSSWMDTPSTPSAPAQQSWTGGGAGAQQYGGGGGMASYGSTAQNQQNTLGLVSLICGILSLVCLGLLTGIPAVITGYMQLNKIKSDPATYGGRGLAIGGIVMGAIGTLFSLLGLLLILAGAIGGR